MASKTHWIGGAGLHGYLYQEGPEYFGSLEAAVDHFADAYYLGRGRRARLKRDRSLELDLDRDGNEYIEINDFPCTGDGCEWCAQEEDPCRS